jgi:Domain of unknown function (DUF4258)
MRWSPGGAVRSGQEDRMDIAEIRSLLRQGNFEFSQHAFRRAAERNVSEDDLRKAGSKAELIEDYPEDKYSPSCLLLGFSKADRPLHMQVCYTDDRTLKIITMYEPKPEEWINYRVRRLPS